MAVTASNLIYTSSDIATNNGSNHTFRYRVHVDSAMTAHEVYDGALTATPDPVPPLYAVLSTDGGMFCQSVSVTQHADNESRVNWIVEALYSQLPEGEDEQDDQANFTQRPPKIRLDWLPQTKELKKDALDAKIQNSKTQPFPEPITIDISLPVFVISKFYRDLDEVIDIQKALENTVNDSDFLGYEAGSARFDGIVAGAQRTDRGQPYIETTTRVVCSNEGFKVKRVDEGLVYEDDDGNDVTETDGAGQWVPITALLDGEGKKLAVDEDPVVLEFDIYPEADYDVLL